MAYWIEKTYYKRHADRQTGDHAVGRALWSPTSSANGRDIYSNMRKVRTGDVVFHLVDNQRIIGVSLVQSEAADNFMGLAGTDHANRPSYRIELSDFRALDPPIGRNDWLGSEKYAKRLWDIQSNNSDLVFNRNLELNQGKYLTSVPDELIALWAEVYRAIGGGDIPHIGRLGGSGAPSHERVSESIADATTKLIADVSSRGYVFEPWQLASYITALRTKPFVILAGVSGTGKSRLPVLVAEATGSVAHTVPVTPDWTDSSSLLGYYDLQNRYREGYLLSILRTALRDTDTLHVCVLDELNLARVEYYLAEVLSCIEDRRPVAGGGYESAPLFQGLEGSSSDMQILRMPRNFALVGTVNMDETTHGFSRKVLDRAFTIELSDIELSNWKNIDSSKAHSERWDLGWLFPRASRLSELTDLDREEQDLVEHVVSELEVVNRILAAGQIQVGYRIRDETAMFVLHSRDLQQHFVDARGRRVEPLDLALNMKILPRLAGGMGPLRRVIYELLGWSVGRSVPIDEDESNRVCREWNEQGCPSALSGAAYPRTAARLCLMFDRLQHEGFTSYWL